MDTSNILEILQRLLLTLKLLHLFPEKRAIGPEIGASLRTSSFHDTLFEDKVFFCRAAPQHKVTGFLAIFAAAVQGMFFRDVVELPLIRQVISLRRHPGAHL